MAGPQGIEAAQTAPAGGSSQAEATPIPSQPEGNFTEFMSEIAGIRTQLKDLAKRYPAMGGAVQGAIEALIQGMEKQGKSQKESQKGIKY